MSEESKFEWYDFYELGLSLLNNGEVVELRTAINRFYFAAFCYARDYLIDNKIFLNSEYKKVMLSETSAVHSQTRDIFEENPQFNYGKSKKGEKIAWALRNLRKKRNVADYDGDVSKGALLNNAKFCQGRSKIVKEVINDL